MWSRWAMDLVNTRNRGFPMANLTVEIWPTLRIPTMILQPLISKHEYTKYMISVTLPSKKVIMALRFFPEFGMKHWPQVIKHAWLVVMNPCYSIMFDKLQWFLMAGRDFEIQCQADLPFPFSGVPSPSPQHPGNRTSAAPRHLCEPCGTWPLLPSDIKHPPKTCLFFFLVLIYIYIHTNR